MLHTKKPREQDGRDSFSRYRAQVRSAAMASLSILEGEDVDRVYCDLHDDFVIRKNAGNSVVYEFYQVKTKGKQNHNWSLNEIFGIKSTIKDQSKQDSKKIKDSFIGKLLVHTVVFKGFCNSVCFQTNIHNADDVERLYEDIANGKYENKFVRVLVERFNELYSAVLDADLSVDEVKKNLSKLRFETDVQYLKSGDDYFEPLARDAIYKFSEVDLEYQESREIIIKLLDLVERKSSGVIYNFNSESIEKAAGISIDDLLAILSISRDAYENLVKGGDKKAIKNASIIQRTLMAAGAGADEVEYCSRCKTNWDLWLRNNRHVIPEFELHTISSSIRKLLISSTGNGNSIGLSSLGVPIKELSDDLKSNNMLYDLNVDLILGGVFSELVKGKS